MSRPSLIAIDGPEAAGKTSLGRLLAARLGYQFIDSGDLYRALTSLAMKRHIPLDDGQALVRLVKETPASSLLPAADSNAGSATDTAVAAVARIPDVRLAMIEKQRSLARAGKVVMAGREIGATVLPQAEMKLYLMASTIERARRRCLHTSKGTVRNVELVEAELINKDKLDQERKDSPLGPVSGATIINTDNPAEQIADRVLWLMDK